MIGSEVIHTERTTPESFELQGLLRRMADAGCTHAVMEVSSHALQLDRVYGIQYAVGIFTNLSQDHLDFHKTMENYCDAKALLFRQCDIGIYNTDDPWHERLLKDTACPRLFSYSVRGEADLMAKNVALHPGSVDFDAEARDGVGAYARRYPGAVHGVQHARRGRGLLEPRRAARRVRRRARKEPRRQGAHGDHPHARQELHHPQRLFPQARRARERPALGQELCQGAHGRALRLRRRP